MPPRLPISVPPPLATARVTATATTAAANWIKLSKLTYTDPTGALRVWECADRTTRSGTCDAVAIIALVRPVAHISATPHNTLLVAGVGPYVVLLRQFRPPTGRTCLEFPAGLVDPRELTATAALRELHEETGFVATQVAHRSPLIHTDPGMCSTTSETITVEIDLADVRNQQPQPQLEEGEFIDTFLVPLRDLYAVVQQHMAAGYAIDARVDGIANGMRLASTYL